MITLLERPVEIELPSPEVSVDAASKRLKKYHKGFSKKSEKSVFRPFTYEEVYGPVEARLRAIASWVDTGHWTQGAMHRWDTHCSLGLIEHFEGDDTERKLLSEVLGFPLPRLRRLLPFVTLRWLYIVHWNDNEARDPRDVSRAFRDAAKKAHERGI